MIQPIKTKNQTFFCILIDSVFKTMLLPWKKKLFVYGSIDNVGELGPITHYLYIYIGPKAQTENNRSFKER